MDTVQAECRLDSLKQRLTNILTVELRRRGNFLNSLFFLGGILWGPVIRPDLSTLVVWSWSVLYYKARYKVFFLLLFFLLIRLIFLIFFLNQRCETDVMFVYIWRLAQLWLSILKQMQLSCFVDWIGTAPPSCRTFAACLFFLFCCCNATGDCDHRASVWDLIFLTRARCDAQTPGLCGAVQEGPGQVGPAA